MRLTTIVATVALAIFQDAAVVRAHHAFAAEFDVNKPVKLEGTLVKWEMINPHSWFHIDVKAPDGTSVVWMIEGGSPNQLKCSRVRRPPSGRRVAMCQTKAGVFLALSHRRPEGLGR